MYRSKLDFLAVYDNNPEIEQLLRRYTKSKEILILTCPITGTHITIKIWKNDTLDIVASGYNYYNDDLIKFAKLHNTEVKTYER
jgi:hypothetical protein